MFPFLISEKSNLRSPHFTHHFEGHCHHPRNSVQKDLGRFYESLLGFGDEPLITPKTLAHITRRHREGLFDRTFQHVIDMGLGFVLNSNRYGIDTVPYGYGPFASDGAFGHSGAQCSCAFADPDHDLVIAWVVNGAPGEPRHQKRARAINTAIYEDLGLAN